MVKGNGGDDQQNYQQTCECNIGFRKLEEVLVMNRCSIYPITGNYSSSSSTKGTSARNGNSNQISSCMGSKTVRGSYLKPPYKSTHGTSNGTSQASKSRALPAGPGPLPNKPNVDICRNSVRYVVQSQPERRQAAETVHYSNMKSINYGHGSKTEAVSSNWHHNLMSSGRKSKSLTNLLYDAASQDETSGLYDARSSGYNSNKYKSTSRYSDHGQIMKASCKSSYTTDSVPSSRAGFKSSYSEIKELRSRGRTDRESFPSSTGMTCVDRGNVRQKEIITASPTELKMSGRSSSSSCSSPPNEKRSSEGLVGLRNLGNTCFMNSVLQCLSHTRPLTEVMLKGSKNLSINNKSSMKGKLFQAFADLVKSMWKSSNTDTVLSPHSFKTQIQRFAPRFVGYNQQDAQEFLRFLLEGLHDDLNQVRSKPQYKPCEFKDSLGDSEKAQKFWEINLARDNSFVTDIFVGQLKSTLKCCTCGYKSVTFDPFWDLSLPIPRRSYTSRRSSLSDDFDIEDCMQLFTKEEELDGDERPTCEKCKTKRKSTKKFTIQRFPRILVLHLKRFSGFGFRSKLQTNVDFSHTLNLSEFASDSSEGRGVQYNLYAVSNHSGTTYGGHYTAYCRHPYSNEWHCFNDSRVDSMSSLQVRGSQTYILFYEKAKTKSSL